MKTKRLFLLFAVALTANAQSPEKASGNAWLDLFGGPNGTVVYPQYAWKVPTSIGTMSGYGFLEVAPYEKLFQNNLVVFTPKPMAWFSVHAEIGDLPAHWKGFVQVGPRVNLHNAVPKLAKVLPSLWVAYLPELRGIRTTNLVAAGATRQFPIIGQKFTAHLEGFDRIFGTFDYGEVWAVGHVRGLKHLEPVAHVIRDSTRRATYTVDFGFRLSLKP